MAAFAFTVCQCLVASGAQLTEDFAGGTAAWQAGAAWSAMGAGTGSAMVADATGDEFAWNNRVSLQDSWVVEVDLTFQSLYNDGKHTGSAGIALANDQGALLYLADVVYSEDAWLNPGMSYQSDGWHNTLESGAWQPGGQSAVKLRLERSLGSDRLSFQVTCPNGFKKSYTSQPIPAAVLNQATRLGLRAFKSKVHFARVEVVSHMGPETAPSDEAQQLVDEARGLLERGQFEDALQRLNNAVGLNPRFPEAYFFRGIAFEGIEKYQEALADHQRAAELRPTFKQAWFEQSRIYDRLEQYDLTVRATTKVIELDPQFWQAWLGRGRAQYYLNLDELALPDLDRAIEINSSFADAFHYRALAHERQDQIAEAIEDRKRAVAAAPEDFKQQFRLATALWNAYLPEEAVVAATRAIELDPAPPGGWRVRASARAQLERYEESLLDYTELVRIEPQNPHSFRDRGLVHLHLGHLERAMADFERAVQLAPRYGPNYLARGRGHLVRLENQEALDDFNTAGQLGVRGQFGRSIERHDLWQFRGEAYLGLNQLDQAIADFSRVIEHRFGGDEEDGEEAALLERWAALNGDAWMNRPYLTRGWAYKQAGQLTNALADLNVWLERRPGDALGSSYRDQIQADLKNLDAAASELSRSILQADSSRAREHRGAIYFKLGKLREAFDDFLAALKQTPDSEYAAGMLVKTAIQLARIPETVQLLTELLANNPTNAVLLEKRGKLHSNAERWKQALADYSAASQLKPGIGRLHFYQMMFHANLGELTAALSAAEASLACQDLSEEQRRYLVIFTALSATGNAATRQRLEAEARANDASWPMPILKYLAGEIEFEAVTETTKENGKLTELYTYAGWSELNQGRTQKAGEYLDRVREHGAREYMEFHLAHWLLQRMSGNRAGTATSEDQR